MGACNIRLTLMTILVVIGILGYGTNFGSADCGVDVSGLVEECEPYMGKLGTSDPPPPACCDKIKKIDWKCVCWYLSRGIGKLDPGTFKVAENCEPSVYKYGYPCQTYTFPGAQGGAGN